MQRGPDCLSGSNATQNASASTRSPVPGSDKPPYAATIFNHNGARPAPLGCLERGLAVDHSALKRWVLAYAPLIERRLRSLRKPHCGSIRIDETYIKTRGQWRYLYRAIDKRGTS